MVKIPLRPAIRKAYHHDRQNASSKHQEMDKSPIPGIASCLPCGTHDIIPRDFFPLFQ